MLENAGSLIKYKYIHKQLKRENKTRRNGLEKMISAGETLEAIGRLSEFTVTKRINLGKEYGLSET